MGNNTKVLEATRATLAKKDVTPLHFLEAVALEENQTKHEALLLDVTTRVACAADPVGAAANERSEQAATLRGRVPTRSL